MLLSLSRRGLSGFIAATVSIAVLLSAPGPWSVSALAQVTTAQPRVAGSPAAISIWGIGAPGGAALPTGGAVTDASPLNDIGGVGRLAPVQAFDAFSSLRISAPTVETALSANRHASLDNRAAPRSLAQNVVPLPLARRTMLATTAAETTTRSEAFLRAAPGGNMRQGSRARSYSLRTAMPVLTGLTAGADARRPDADPFTIPRAAFDGLRSRAARLNDPSGPADPARASRPPVSAAATTDLASRLTRASRSSYKDPASSGGPASSTGHAPSPVPLPSPRRAADSETLRSASLRSSIANFLSSKFVAYAVPALLLAGVALTWHGSLLRVAIISGAMMASIVLHETGHLWAELHYGDPTPALAGRKSLNPLHGVDLLGTILVPAAALAVTDRLLRFPILFGWVKAVPADFNRFKNTKTDPAKVALAGLAVSFAIAALTGGAWLALTSAGLLAGGGATAFLLTTFFKMNASLTLFNLIPLPWHDGGKIAIAYMPARMYSWWIHHPRLRAEYQRLHGLFYEGPTYVLTRLGIKSQRGVNLATRLVSLGALGAFYAIFFATLSFPVLFLALPCGGYNYYCIHEKVRADKAVEEFMDLSGELAAAFVQAAEDLGVKGVSPYEAEFAWVTATDRVLDEFKQRFKDDERFRGLSDAELVQAFMKEFPEMWFQLVKERVLKGQSDEKIREILADPRLQPFVDRLQKWLLNPENEEDAAKAKSVFERMKKPAEGEKFDDAVEEAKRERHMGGQDDRR